MKKKIILCPNPYRDPDLLYAKKAEKILTECGFDCIICTPFDPETATDDQARPMRVLQHELNNADLLISFGGDGTILHLASLVALNNVPVLGVNLGSLGFMTELEANELDHLYDLKNWDFISEPRMMLNVTVFRDNRAVFSTIALNDAVISKGSIARVVRLNISTEEGKLTSVVGDGVIISSPTGSTGYSLAAGGPVVEPTAKNIIISPICAHTTRNCSYVLSPDHVITVKMTDENRKYVYLSADGGKAFSLKNGDEIRICKAKFVTKLVRLSKSKSFCEILDYKFGMEVTKK